MTFGKKKSTNAESSAGSSRAAKKAARKVQVAESKAVKAGKELAKSTGAVGLINHLTDPKTAKRAVTAAKIAGPAVAPYALKAATNLRGYLDGRRADKLGVPAAEVAGYRGSTGAVAARIAGLQSSVDDLRRRRSTDLQVTRFAEVAKSRLADLRAATKAAGSMPSGRRRTTLSAIGKDLNQIDADLMTFLVGRVA